MRLQEKLDDQKKQSSTRIPLPDLEIMDRANDDLRRSGILENILKPGDRAPEFSLPDSQKKIISSGELLSRGPLVISFYRGVW